MVHVMKRQLPERRTHTLKPRETEREGRLQDQKEGGAHTYQSRFITKSIEVTRSLLQVALHEFQSNIVSWGVLAYGNLWA
jgi:hypothetical protein